MKKHINKWAAFVSAIGICVVSISSTQAQESEQVAPVRFGLFGGANYNSVGVGGSTPIPLPGISPDLSDGTGLGPYGGLLFEYNPGLGKVLGVHARVGYDSRNATFSSSGQEVVANVGYFSFEPAMQLNLGSPNFHFTIGPSINVLATNDFTVDTNGVRTDGIKYGRLNDVTFGMWGGVGYDIALNKMKDNGTQWYLTPFFEGSWMVDQVKTTSVEADNIDDSWSTVTVRGGLQLKYGFGGPQTEALPEVAEEERMVTPQVGVIVTAPAGGVATARPMQEYLPMLNYVFFSSDQPSQVPTRYAKLNTSSAQSFSEAELTTLQKPSAGGGSNDRTRSQRQMDVYHNMLNIVGDRMRDNPSATIRVVGSAPDQKDGVAHAEMVKSYLVSTFGIAADRIKAEGRTTPPHASGTRNTPKEDLSLIAEENNRVEILSDNDRLLQPVSLNVYQEQPAESNLVVRIAPNVPISRWQVRIEGNGYSSTYGPFYESAAYISAAPILGDRKSGTYNAKVTVWDQEGKEISNAQAFTLQKKEGAPEKSTRYSILFEYDASQSVAKYDTFLREKVAPEIPNGAMVYVHGHTDVAGMEDYNDTLSVKRAEEAKQILASQLKKLGRTASFEAWGSGEATNIAPFTNDSPEGRYYNRTVMIEIVAPASSVSAK